MSGDWPPADWEGPRTADAETRRRLDELLSVLAERRRRDILYHLLATDVTDVESLASTMGAVQEGVPPEEVPTEVQTQVRIELVHTHLPKLAEAGAIEYDPRSEAVRCRELPPMLERLLSTCIDVEVEEDSVGL